MLYPFFFYGTLKTNAKRSNRFAYLLDGYRRITTPARVVGYRLHALEGAPFPYLCSSNDLEIVYGELVWIHQANYASIMEMLDRLEGVPDLYQRVRIPVLYNEESVQDAWVYLPTKDSVKHLPVIDGGEW